MPRSVSRFVSAPWLAAGIVSKSYQRGVPVFVVGDRYILALRRLFMLLRSMDSYVEKFT